jgi:hypothetical protein
VEACIVVVRWVASALICAWGESWFVSDEMVEFVADHRAQRPIIEQ